MFGDDNTDTNAQNNTQTPAAATPATPPVADNSLHGFTMDPTPPVAATAPPADTPPNPATPVENNPALPDEPASPAEPVGSFPPSPAEPAPVTTLNEPSGAPVTDDKPTEEPNPALPPEPVIDTSIPELPEVSSDDTNTPADETPADDNQNASTDDESSKTDESTESSSDNTPSPSSDDGNNGDLMSIKQQALQQLSPIVSHLDQSPEEKFRTTMMMIQASDDESLIQSAYDSAQQITDEKAKAQALLDVVNEINYFSQQKSEESN